MAPLITANSYAGEKDPYVPYKEESGEFYNYIMYFDNNSKIAYDDDVAELIELIIPGYGELDEEERLNARLSYALRMQKQAQSFITANLSSEEREKLKEWELEVISGTYNKERPYAIRGFWRDQLADDGVELSEDEDEDNHRSVWKHSQIPLVLIDFAYYPWTELDPPLGNPDGSNIIWLNATDEVQFLHSLNIFGETTFGELKHEN